MLTPALRSSLPLLIGMFITKCVAIGLSLIPILIVDLHLDKDTSALSLTMVRGAMLAGPIIGGYLIDLITPRRALFIGMAGSALGMLGLSMASNSLMVVGFGALAQLCQMIVMSTARYLLVTLCKPEHHVEALGWFRTVNNGAQIFSYSLGWGLGHFGLPALFLMDAVTSFIALGVSIRLIPLENAGVGAREATPAFTNNKPVAVSNTPLWKISFLIASYGFLSELFYSALPAKLRLLYGADGVSIFSKLMLVNVILCALLTIVFSKYASKHSNGARRTLLIGLLFVFIGGSVCILMTEHRYFLFFGFLVITLGELLFQSLAQFVVMRLVPDGKKSGSTYGLSVAIHGGGRLLGASMAFPFFIYGGHPVATLSGIAAVISCVFLWSRKSIPISRPQS